MVKVASLEADIKINSGDASKKLDEINKKLDNLDNASEKTARNTSLNWVTAVGSLMNGADKVIRFLGSQADRVKELGFNYDRLSRMTGHSAQEFQRWKAIIEQSGGSFDDFMASLDSLRKIKANFLMTGNVPEVFGRLGIMPTGEDIEILQQVTEKLKNIQDISLRNYLASQAGISADIIGILTSGGDIGYFDRSMQLTEKQLEAAREMRKESIILAQRWEQVLNRIGTVILPILNKLSAWGIGIANDVLDTVTGGGGSFENGINAMREAGFSENAIAGILGNASVESGFNPNASNGSHWGLFQWDINRWAKYKRMLKENKEEDTLDNQIAFMMLELIEYGPKFFSELNNAQTPEEAAMLFEKKFERSGGQAMDKRKRRARAVAQMLGSGEPLTAEGVESLSSSFSPSGGVYSNVSNYNNEFGGNRNIYIDTTYNVSTNKFDGNSVKEADGDIEKKVAAAVSR